VPGQLIYGVAFNTNTWGSQPTGQPGPYESLNFGVTTPAPGIGTNPLTGTAYWNTAAASNYTDGGAGGVGTFRPDTGWSYSGAIGLDASAAPKHPDRVRC
jgi:hypothetical protein